MSKVTVVPVEEEVEVVVVNQCDIIWFYVNNVNIFLYVLVFLMYIFIKKKQLGKMKKKCKYCVKF